MQYNTESDYLEQVKHKQNTCKPHNLKSQIHFQ